MYIVEHIFLAMSAFISCTFSLYWQGVETRRTAKLSFIACMVCGLSICFHKDIRFSIAVSVFFVLIYFTIIFLQPGMSYLDAVAAGALSCAGLGMLQVTVGTILNVDIISEIFRIVLSALFLLIMCILLRIVSHNFPGKEWKEYFQENVFVGKQKLMSFNGFCCLLVVYGVCCTVPAVAGTFSVPMLVIEWLGFGVGTSLLNLIISNRKNVIALKEEQQSKDNMQTYMSVIRSQRHDYNFHVQTLQGLLQKKDYSACEEYLNELLADSIEMNNILPVSDAAISALIFSFKNKAEQKKIDIEILIENDLSKVATSVYETNKIIGNLLQNAMDETEKLQDKSYGIKLSTLKRGEFCIISVSNKTEKENPMGTYQVGHSTKNGHEGIGIASVRAILDRCGGVIYSRMEDDIIFFVAKIPILLIGREE